MYCWLSNVDSEFSATKTANAPKATNCAEITASVYCQQFLLLLIISQFDSGVYSSEYLSFPAFNLILIRFYLEKLLFPDVCEVNFMFNEHNEQL